jgi:sugar O-acyltransferase (sialic acid O-acetyltransferase NeuD family)
VAKIRISVVFDNHNLLMVKQIVNRAVILGGGGHARVLIESLQDDPSCQLVGILDPDLSLHGSFIYDIQVLGDDTFLKGLVNEGLNAFIVGLGSIGSTISRQRLYLFGLSYHLIPLNVQHPTAFCSFYARLGQGVQIMPRATINAGAIIGDNVIINTGAVVEHDCMISEHCHIASGAILSGGVQVGAGTHIGAGSVVRQGIKIGENVVVGAGAAVVKDIPSGQMVVGVPARLLSRT